MNAPWWASCLLAAVAGYALIRGNPVRKPVTPWLLVQGGLWVFVAIATDLYGLAVYGAAHAVIWGLSRWLVAVSTPLPRGHVCEPPTREVGRRVSTGLAGGGGIAHREVMVDGDTNVWRCPICRELWRVGRKCGVCDRYGVGSHRGQCMVGTMWRPARPLQRLRAAMAGRS